MKKKIKPANGRTPLWSALRRAMRLARIANHSARFSTHDVSVLSRDARFSRREFLTVSAASMAGISQIVPQTAWASPAGKRSNAPRIVIVGAGMAGLHAAYTLKKAGYAADIYEAANRTGGRMITASDLLGPGLVTELGGEFIDSIHDDLLNLAQEFGLELWDTHTPAEADLDTGYFFNGVHYSEEEVVAAFRPFAAKIERDYDSTDEVVDYTEEGGAGELDRLSITEYLDRIGASGWIRELLEVAYVTEYGLDADRQSSLNLIFLLGEDLSEGQADFLIGADVPGGEFEVFGESDERFKVVGGNQRFVDELANRLAERIHVGNRLIALRELANCYRLTFDTDGGSTTDSEADFVILALPFTLLRTVDMVVEMPEVKWKAINELGYGTNAKIMAGFNNRVWQIAGFSGEVFSDRAFQVMWDNSLFQPGTLGGLTYFSGGQLGLDVGENTALFQAQRLTTEANFVFPGLASAFNGIAARMHWPSYPFTLGSYSCYTPGQWTTIAGAEFLPVGHLFFAGEHTSYEFQGYMNGAAETGRRAAEGILAIIGSTAGMNSQWQQF